jgi:hypothetical protein
MLAAEPAALQLRIVVPLGIGEYKAAHYGPIHALKKPMLRFVGINKGRLNQRLLLAL